MATEFLREKIQTLTNMVQNEAVQIFQQQMIAKGNSNPTGDQAIDDAMKVQAQSANVIVAAASKRLEVYRVELATIKAEQDALEASQKQAASAA